VRRTAGTLVLLALMGAPAIAQVTTAERSGFRTTSSHADVLAFLDSLALRGAGIRTGTLGHTPQGRPIPYVIASRPLVDDPAAAHRSGKPILMIQGNIHGGEVEGKEVTLMLLRDLTLGSLRPLLDSVVLIVVPNYNADGNDAFGPAARQRPGQDGPDPVGLRPNSQGLNLNRDYTKQVAPETRGAAALINAWDPDIFIDLHTTNGSYHGYALTYSPGLNPNSSVANDWVRERFLPAIRTQVRQRHGHEMFWYGNFRNQHPDSLVQGWWTYDARPRFGVNWMGMRGRMGILSEAYSNDPFETRVRATYSFVLEILRLAAAERATIKRLGAEASAQRPDSVGVRSDFAPPRTMDVIAEITQPAGAGAGGFGRRQRTGEFRTIAMPVYDRFVATRKEAMPAAYLLPTEQGHLIEGLRRHGVVVHQLTAPWEGALEAFRVDSMAVAMNLFEGHRLVTVEGAWQSRAGAAPVGWYLVSTDQRLGVLAAYLLEPASEDGFLAWNFLDRDLRRGAEVPVFRVRRPVQVPAVLLP
jgi:hypothetical protein